MDLERPKGPSDAISDVLPIFGNAIVPNDALPSNLICSSIVK